MKNTLSDISSLSLAAVRDALISGTCQAEAVVQACAETIATTQPAVNSLISTVTDQALEQAQAMDKQGPQKDQPLWGIPLVLKDILSTKGLRTTCGSKILDKYIPFFDATAVARLKQAGAIIIGKANMDEFAMGSDSSHSAYGRTKNPRDTSRVAGGSSGGSAASVAARQCFGALGTDTGGSIRQPASFCGIVGMKPTYGRVSRFGCIAYGSSLDQIGPMARTVKDTALLLQVIAGFDEKDSTSARIPVPDYLRAMDARTDMQGLRLGVPEQYFGLEGLDPEVDAVCQHSLRCAEKLGATLVPVSLPHSQYSIAAYYIIAMAEASSNLARFDGMRYGLRVAPDKDADLIKTYFQSRSAGFGEEVQRRIMLGTYVLSAGYYDAYYKKAAQVRRLIRDDFLHAFEQCDLLCAPASPVVAWPTGEMTHDPLQMYLMDIFTVSANLAGIPGLCLPAGTGKTSSMPVGLQLLGPAFSEELLLSTAGMLEKKLSLNTS